MIVFRHNDNRFPPLWEDAVQPAARWHRKGEGPVQYLADTPIGAWAEFLRHEEIVDEIDLQGVRRALWAIQIDDADFASPKLPEAIIRGGEDSYPACQAEADHLRKSGANALRTDSAALHDGAARGWRVEHGYQEGPEANGQVFVLFGTRPQAVCWRVVDEGRPPAEVLPWVRPLQQTSELLEGE